MRIIPAIDIIDGKCVRLTKGDFNAIKIYNDNPVDVAKQFESYGIRYLHLVDLDGARSGAIVNQKILLEISTSTNLKIDFGGGIKSKSDLKIAFECGASQVTLGSIALTNESLFKECLFEYGSGKIILGADCKDRKIVAHGWLQESEIGVIDFIKKYERLGIEYVICTDVSKDGMLQGASNELYSEILSSSKVKLIASGGVSAIQDVLQLEQTGCEAVIIGKAIYEGKISLDQLADLC